ncbi:MAG: hypothetical protein K0R22_748 [Sporomusa sp.]|jgi:uncharacterized protein (UPF0305 family)|nr:hypothetical protein [Sporomusa sp.]
MCLKVIFWQLSGQQPLGRLEGIMNNLELFNQIKLNANYFSVEDSGQRNTLSKQVQPVHKTNNTAQMITEYNRQTLFEIKNSKGIADIEDIDIAVLNEFAARIDKYLDKYAPQQADLKKYILLISTYLTFIAKKPLHPVGLEFAGGEQIIIQDNKFYCPAKNRNLLDELSVCRYCVSKDISAIGENR